MTSSHFLKLKRLARSNHIAAAAKHNLRELQSERGAEAHIDANRSRLNRILDGDSTASGVKNYAERLMRDAGVLPLRNNAVRAIEIVISLPVESTVNQAQYFDDSLQWAKNFFMVPIISAVVHLDEAAPHMHILLLPLLDGKMQGDKVAGDRKRLVAMQESFYNTIGKRHGLKPHRRAIRLDSATRQKAAELFFHATVDNPDLFLRTNVKSAVMVAYSKDPEPLLTSIGLRMPTRPRKSLAAIMCKPCKPEFPTYQTISFQDPAEMINPYVSVGVLPSPPHPAPATRESGEGERVAEEFE